MVREDAVEARPHLVAVPDAEEEPDEELDEEPQVEALALFEEPAAVPTHADETVTIPHPAAAEPAAAVTPTGERKPPARKPKARKGRASVPSWDEILFGADALRRATPARTAY